MRIARRALPLILALLLPGLVPAAHAATPPGDCLVEVGGVNLQTATILDLQEAMSRPVDPLTSEELVNRYLQRIAFFDSSGASLNSIRALNPNALQEARELDAERAAGHVRGPLHGVPVLLKDNVGTVEMPTTAGSIALKGLVPVRDAFITQRLREAGAIILGKTNLSEFANWVDLSMPNGYSSLGGQVKNAYTFGDPSGSSAGSGVAESMALTTAAVGTETSGSIISPSTANGVVGIKPTLGLTSRAGVVPLAPSFDVVGPMTRNVTDAAIMLGAMTGVDARDAATAAQADHVPPNADYTPVLDPGRLVGARLGFDPNDRPSGAAGTVFDRAVADLKAAGAEMVTLDDSLKDGANVGLAEIGAIPNEFKASLNQYLSEQPTPASGVKTLADIVAYNDQHPDEVKYGQNLLIASNATPGDMTVGAPNREASVRSAQTAIDQTFIRNDLDAIISSGAQYVNVGAAAGYPTITVPAGLAGGNRVSLSFLGRAWYEPRLIGFAYAYEQASQRRVPPTAVNAGLFPEGCSAT
ncbi:MAG: amidase family protein [Actinomycetota bacterium]